MKIVNTTIDSDLATTLFQLVVSNNKGLPAYPMYIESYDPDEIRRNKTIWSDTLHECDGQTDRRTDKIILIYHMARVLTIAGNIILSFFNNFLFASKYISAVSNCGIAGNPALFDSPYLWCKAMAR